MAHRWFERYLDAGMGTPLSARRGWVVVRTVAMVVAAVAGWVFEVDGRGKIVLIAAAGVVAQALLVSSQTKHAAVFVSLIDVALLSVGFLALPKVWPVAMFWLGSTVAWLGLVAPRRIALPIMVFSWVWITVLNALNNFDMWWLLSIAHLVLIAMFCSYGGLIRRSILRSELELEHSVTATGGVITRGNLGTGRWSHVYGDTQELLGYSRAEWLDLELMSILHPDDINGFWVPNEDLVNGARLERIARYRHADGHYVWINDVEHISDDEDGTLIMRGYLTNVNELQNTRRQLEVQALTDLLTGLPNRHDLERRLADLVASKRPFGLLIADLDRFKEINDILGHAAGDRLLQAIAERLEQQADDTIYAARLGGDEFALLVEDAHVDDDLAPLVDLIVSVCAEPFVLDGVPIAVGISTGTALSADADDHATVMRHADIAMYEAKRDGRTHTAFNSSLERNSTRRLALSGQLADAIERGQVVLYTQPKIDLYTGHIVGAEGLARWQHPEYGLLTPWAFLDVALVSEHLKLFESAMIAQAIGHAHKLRELGHEMPISVNVSVRTIRDPGFAARVLSDLAAQSVPNSSLIIEITEDVVDDDSPAFLENLTTLHESGVAVSIDDFGTGYSSLQRVSALAVDELKIDRAFVDDIHQNETSGILVQSVIELAQRLDLEVVAEGVETSEHAAHLRKRGCRIAQGYLFDPALTPSVFFDRVAANHRYHINEPDGESRHEQRADLASP